MTTIFKKTVLFSLLGHLTVFSLFSFSFGNKIPQANYTHVSFWGDFLYNADLVPAKVAAFNINRREIFPLSKPLKESPQVYTPYLKPAVNLTFSGDKLPFMPQKTSTEAIIKKEPVVMFYPQLPPHFLLYFQNRQAVHIELMFNIISSGKVNTVNIKRKISSGNLEADLLTMRYIGHYLFIQQSGFPHDAWQTVKIDLSTKE